MERISASIGILTFNSAENLERCLKSIKDFTDVVAADGGSTDGTLDILSRYGVRVISQTTVGKPITDFAAERNQLLDAAKEAWFFYLDSDEIMSPELKEAIRAMTTDEDHPYQAYKVRYLKTDATGTRLYRTYREYYQVRLVRTDIGAHFVRPVHERISLPDTIRIGQTESPWYVPLDSDDLSVSVFARKAWKRTRSTADSWVPQGIGDAFQKILIEPFTLVLKSLVKIPVVKIRWKSDAIPVKYELLRILYSCMLSIQHMRRLVFGHAKSRSL